MKHIITVVCSMLFTQLGISQFPYCEWSWAETCQVSAESGLKLRSGQSLEGKTIAVIPFQDIVRVCYENTIEDTIDQRYGRWVKTFWKGQRGYVFDGYLEKIEKDSDIRLDNSNLAWYDAEKGAANIWEIISYLKDQDYYGLTKTANKQDFLISKIKLDEKENEDISFSSINGEIPLWIFGKIGYPEGTTIKGQMLNRMLFIGEKVETNHGVIYGDGILHKEDSINIEGFRIDPYELRFQSKYGEDKQDQLLLRMKCWGGISKSIGYEADAIVNFIGDLDGDGKDDILITFQNTYKAWYYKFFSTRYADPGKMFKEMMVGAGGE